MKTPKPSTPATKSKLNTPRSGFIQKNSDSSKKVKFSVLSSADKKLNGTPKLEYIPFKEKKFNNFSGKKSIVLNNADKHLNGTPKLENTPFKEKQFNNFSGKKSISPFSAKVNANNLIANKQTNLSPIKRKADTESTTEGLKSVEKPSKKCPKTGNQFQNSPSSKFKRNKTSPEVQLGLDIEQYLDKKSSIKKNKNDVAHATPLGNKQQEIKALKQTSLKFPKDNSEKGKVRAKNKKQLTNTGKASRKIALTKTNESADVNGLVNSITLKNAVKAIIKYVDDNPKQRNEIFGVHVPFFIQVNFVKVPTSRRTRILVPHSALPENSDICLFITDKKKKTRDPEDLIDETKNLLRKCGVSCVTEIMPWRHALKEHTQYEQGKKLADRFDLFLIEGGLAKLKRNLFKSFPAKKKPIPVILEPSSKVAISISKAIRKLSIISKGIGLSKTIKFGHYKMEPDQLTENIEEILKIMCNEKYFPGGRNNIRSIVIKTVRSLAFPLYISTKSPNLVEAPVQEVVREDEDAVEGELTTYPNCTVKVFKDGTVVTKPIKENVKKKKAKELKGTKKQEEDEELEDDADSESDEEDNDIEEDDSENEKELEKEEEEEADEEEEEDEEDPELELEVDQIDNNDEVKNLPKKNKKSNKKQYESSTDEDGLEEAEQSFLQELRQMQDEIESKKTQKKSNIRQQTINKKNPVKREASLKSQHGKKSQENLEAKKTKKKKAKVNKAKVPSGDDHKKTINPNVAVNANRSSPSASKKSKKRRPRKNKQNNLSSSQEKMRHGKKVLQ
uniref:Putative ribosomal l1 domain-containing protein 1 n=1 Tax=Panstrongylus megistus TaxID=65343 RepID=A0A069DXF3_9HEMI